MRGRAASTLHSECRHFLHSPLRLLHKPSRFGSRSYYVALAWTVGIVGNLISLSSLPAASDPFFRAFFPMQASKQCCWLQCWWIVNQGSSRVLSVSRMSLSGLESETNWPDPGPTSGGNPNLSVGHIAIVQSTLPLPSSCPMSHWATETKHKHTLLIININLILILLCHYGGDSTVTATTII